MTLSRRLLLAATFAAATAAVAVARLRPRVEGGGVATSRATTPERRTHRHAVPLRAQMVGAASADTVADVTATVVPAPRALRRVAAERFRRGGAAEPHSLQVIAVPVPAQFGGKRVDFTVTPSGSADLLSAQNGTLPATETAAERATTVVSRVPAGAASGPLEVAKVEFSDDSITTTVSVELTIARVRRITLRPVRATTAVYPGQHAKIEFTALNLGNGADTLHLGIDPIPGWRANPMSTLVLQPGEQRTVELDVRTPPPPASGFVPLNLRARVDTASVASVLLPVELLPNDPRGAATRGPTVIAGVATAVGDSTGQSPVLSLAVDGPLSDRVSLRGRFVHATDRADYNLYAMGRVGYFLDGSFLTASGHGWSVTGGRTGMGFSPVFGWNAYGLGTSATLTRGPWNVGVLAVEEKFGQQVGSPQFGARVSRGIGAGTWSFTATHLAQSILFDRTLDAAGLTYQYSRPGVALTLDGGYRSSSTASGPAAAFKVDLHSPRGQFVASAAHAPGGSGAFARATNEMNASAFRRLTPRLILRGYGYGSTDDAGAGAGNTSNARGGGFGPSLLVGHRSNVDLDLSSSRSEFRSSTGSVVSSDLMATLGARTTMSGVGFRGSVGVGQLSRNTQIPLGPTFDRTGRRLILTGAADKQTAVGSFAIEANIEQNDATTGQIPRMTSVSLEASRIRFLTGPRAPVLNATVWVNSYPGAPSAGPAVRIGTEIALPGQFALMLDAERNPYLHAGGRIPIVAAVRFERSIALPGIRRPTTQGDVFDDRNGNGLRDPGEPGMGGVLVRRGDQSIATRPDGSFKFYEPAAPNAAPSVDIGSLAAGQIAPSPSATSGRTWVLPVMRTARLTIQLAPTTDSLGRTPLTKLTVPTVIATDSAGTVWIGHPDTLGTATFDALPAGTYTITVDFSGSTERLRMLESPPVVSISTGAAPAPVRIPFGFRAVRVFDGSAVPGGRRRK